MLDPGRARKWLEHHFDTVTDAEFIANVKRTSPDFAEELWGDRSVEEILADRDRAARERERRHVPRFFAAFGRSIHRLFS